ncbi:MAG: RNA polymerase sigma factor [Vicinamibacterales bacterium]
MPRATHEDPLVGRLRQKDERAVADLVSAYKPKILNMAVRYLKNREDAEEVAQDVLIKVYQQIERFRGDAALSSWIYRIAFNTVMSRLRGAKALRAATLGAGDTESEASRPDAPRHETADWSDLADERLLRRQMRAHLCRAIQALPPMYRVPIILRDLQGLSTAQASQQLSLKHETLKSRLHRGRLMLRHHLSDFAGGVSMPRVVA